MQHPILIVILLLIFILTAIFIYYSYKFKSPYWLEIRFGKPGCGKTTDLCREAIHGLKDGWHVYTNVPINVAGVRLIDNSNIGMWADDNSLILLDEANLFADNRSYKSLPRQVLEYTRLFRHNKVRLILFSQTFDIDLKFRSMAQRLCLCYRIGPLMIRRGVKKVLTIRQAEYAQDADSQIVDNLAFESFLKPGALTFVWLPRWVRYHDTYSKPIVPPLPYTVIGHDD